MTISDSLPIQFWGVDEDTFNESDICGVFDACFCQQFNPDDPIVLQFQDSQYAEYYLNTVADGISSAGTVNFTQTAPGVWQASFIASDLAIVAYPIQGFEIKAVSSPDDVVLAKSDCIKFTEDDCSKLITYSNSDNFDGINYIAGTPAPEFSIRIPAQFWQEDEPMEQEDSELSNGVIITRRQSIVEKRLLEVGFMPNYMWHKLRRILMHENIEIDGDNWKRRDAVNTEPVKRYPLKKGNVWLTKYDSVEKNTL